METKKISFGFMKTKKVQKPVLEESKEYVECMEEKSIKVIGGEQLKEEPPLVIPMKPNTLVTAERLKQIAEEVESVLTEPETGEKLISTEPKTISQNETLDQMAVRELLQEAKKEVNTESMVLTVPVPSKPVIEGQKESTLEDYEGIPIQEFGMAMLRGMGWTPNKETSKYQQPQLRPKGLGLGADKVISENQKKKLATNDKGEELSIVKNSYVKITTGKYSGYYGKVLSLDEDNGRVMVDISVKKETVSLSEFMMLPVTKAEFDKESKVINADTFDEYKKNEKVSQKISTHDSPRRDNEPSSSIKDTKNGNQKDERSIKKTNDPSEGRSRDKHRDSSSSEERSRRRHKGKKKKRRYSSSDSLDSLSDSDKKRKHKSSRKRQSSSSDLDSDSPRREKRKRTPEKKRDIDKKRKGKKKKRDRDRSPNYKKYRK